MISRRTILALGLAPLAVTVVAAAVPARLDTMAVAIRRARLADAAIGRRGVIPLPPSAPPDPAPPTGAPIVTACWPSATAPAARFMP